MSEMPAGRWHASRRRSLVLAVWHSYASREGQGPSVSGEPFDLASRNVIASHESEVRTLQHGPYTVQHGNTPATWDPERGTF